MVARNNPKLKTEAIFSQLFIFVLCPVQWRLTTQGGHSSTRDDIAILPDLFCNSLQTKVWINQVDVLFWTGPKRVKIFSVMVLENLSQLKNHVLSLNSFHLQKHFLNVRYAKEATDNLNDIFCLYFSMIFYSCLFCMVWKYCVKNKQKMNLILAQLKCIVSIYLLNRYSERNLKKNVFVPWENISDIIAKVLL